LARSPGATGETWSLGTFQPSGACYGGPPPIHLGTFRLPHRTLTVCPGLLERDYYVYVLDYG